jgi:hypothetical protein
MSFNIVTGHNYRLFSYLYKTYTVCWQNIDLRKKNLALHIGAT